MKLKRSRDLQAIIYPQVRVFPICPPQNRHRSDGAIPEARAVPELAIKAIFTRKERTLFIQKTAQVLFTMEYVILVEYIEVTMPLVFSKTLWYSSTGAVSHAKPRRTLGFSALSQLAFVLEKHASTVQMKIVTNFVYIMQTTLIHVGLDFSFKFAWLHNK
ncbi:hypothetical protein DVH05_009283 [Phytophthora capsici]|nr:hypothetical protein DVH05_009283 [Phytophthora capsici]